jgi:hypothetical protein
VHCNNEKIILWASERKIEMVQGVPHTTHKTQPLDVGCFNTFNAKYEAIKAAAMADGKAPDPANSITWAKEAWESITVDGVIPGLAKAFTKIGIHPLNEAAFTDEDFKAATLSGKIAGDAREAAGLPRSPEAIISEAFGPALPPAMIESAISRLSTKTTGSVYLTGAKHLSKMASDLLEKEHEEANKLATKEARLAKRAEANKEKAAKAAERLESQAAKAAAAASSAAASTSKKRRREESAAPRPKAAKALSPASAAAAVEPAEARVEARPGKRTRFIKNLAA